MPGQSSPKKKLNPNVSVDCVIFGFDFSELKVLLIDREGAGKRSPDSPGRFLLPGDLILNDEDLDTAAGRVLKELTGLENIYLEQFHTFGDPNRVKREYDAAWLQAVRSEPEARVITVGYYSLVKLENYKMPTASSFAKRADWFAISEVPQLGFDHNEILQKGLEALKMKLNFQPVGFELLPKKFTLGQLQKLYEILLGFELDKRNFRRKMFSKGFLIPLQEKQKGVAHKPAQFYKFDKKQYEKLKEESSYFEF